MGSVILRSKKSLQSVHLFHIFIFAFFSQTTFISSGLIVVSSGLLKSFSMLIVPAVPIKPLSQYHPITFGKTKSVTRPMKSFVVLLLLLSPLPFHCAQVIKAFQFLELKMASLTARSFRVLFPFFVMFCSQPFLSYS